MESIHNSIYSNSYYIGCYDSLFNSVRKRKMIKTEKKLTGIKLTESQEDKIWLHFESKNLKASISLAALVAMQASGIVAATIQNWAEEQLKKQETVHRRFYLRPDEGVKGGTRPSPPVEGGY